MANVRINEKAERIEVRAYAGRDPVTKKTRNLCRMLPINSTDEEVGRVKDALDAAASFCKDLNVDFTVEGALTYRLSLGSSVGYAPSSVEGYESYLRCYVAPYIGDMSLPKLRPYHIESLYKTLMEKGGKDGNPISANTVITLHSFLRRNFRAFVKDGLIPYNPFDAVDKPRKVRTEAAALFDTDLDTLMDYLEEKHAEGKEPLATALLLCIKTGMSRGEVAGLFVGDYRTRAKSIHISRALSETKKGPTRIFYKEPKAATRNRTLPLSDEMTTCLDQHIARQKELLAKAGTKQNAQTPLFARKTGKPYRPGAYTDYFGRCRKACGLDKSAHLHTLRHTHATYLIEARENIKTISEHMGHSNVKTTVDVYTHSFPGRGAQLADTFEKSLGREK